MPGHKLTGALLSSLVAVVVMMATGCAKPGGSAVPVTRPATQAESDTTKLARYFPPLDQRPSESDHSARLRSNDPAECRLRALSHAEFPWLLPPERALLVKRGAPITSVDELAPFTFLWLEDTYLQEEERWSMKMLGENRLHCTWPGLSPDGPHMMSDALDLTPRQFSFPGKGPLPWAEPKRVDQAMVAHTQSPQGTWSWLRSFCEPHLTLEDARYFYATEDLQSLVRLAVGAGQAMPQDWADVETWAQRQVINLQKTDVGGDIVIFTDHRQGFRFITTYPSGLQADTVLWITMLDGAHGCESKLNSWHRFEEAGMASQHPMQELARFNLVPIAEAALPLLSPQGSFPEDLLPEATGYGSGSKSSGSR